MKRIATLVFVLAALWIAALLQSGQQLGLDEVEFFRATRWVSLGQVPFAGFWEHHAPLQWFLFAPVAAFANGAGAASIVAMRWAQVPLWIGLLWMVVALARRAGIRTCGWSIALLLLLVSSTFVHRAIEYRVDVPGNVFFVGAFFAVALRSSRARWIAFGALMSLAVLANMRLAPLVVFAGALSLFRWPEERRWRWNPQALWMAAGIAGVAAAFFGYLAITSSTDAFVQGVFDYNRLSNQVTTASTPADALLLPLWTLDVAGMVFWIAGIAGIVVALRGLREPGPLQVAALFVIVGVLAIVPAEVHYDYHLQNVWLLMLPLGALSISRLERPPWRKVIVAAAVVALLVEIARVAPGFGAAMRYQNALMTAADRLTDPGETVFDGTGYALRRHPAYRYWFLATGVRFLAGKRAIPPYDVAQMAANPPAAVITDYRLLLYLQLFPRLASYTFKHYVPYYRNLWVPGMTATIGPTPIRLVWTAPRAGRYDIWTSDLLAKHPWFRRPFEYVTTTGPRSALLEIPLQRLPPLAGASLEWRVDGHPLAEGVRSLELKKGSRVELTAHASAAAGVMLVRHGIVTLCIAPEEEAVF
jgi:hypothetical protein